MTGGVATDIISSGMPSPKQIKPDLTTPGRRLRHAREQLQLGVRELERLADVSGGQVSRLENDVRQVVNPDTVAALARVLRVRPAWILFGELPMKTLDSGEIPAMHQDAPAKPNLEKTLKAAKGSRWSRTVIAIAMASDQPDVEVDEWVHRLDETENAIRQAGLEGLVDSLASGRFPRSTTPSQDAERAGKKPSDPDPKGGR